MPPLTVGTRLGSYEIVSPLGAGGMGEVYRARHLKLGRDVAVKVLPSEFASDPGRLQRFEREARAASALNHPNIVTIHDIDEHEGTHFIAMELVGGRTLRSLLSEGPLPTGRVLALARQIAEGLARAHAVGIVHRDLKPENLMVTDDGLVKILDFGLAKLAPSHADTDADTATAESATRAGVLLGTVPYMSPEQAAGRPVDFRSDQFSFGSILYEMAAGRRAFQRETTPQTLAAIIEGEPEPLLRLKSRVPPALVAIIDRCLAKKPEDRFGATRDLVSALQGVPERPAAPRVGWILYGAAGLLALGLAASLVPGLRVLSTSRKPGAAPPVSAVAVLPLQNLSGDAEQEYFADGMTEALITDLAKIGALKVISRSSAMRYKGAKKPLAQIAKELGVDAVVEGSAQRVGDRVRIMAQLVDPQTERALWGESYDRAVTDVLRLQGEVAQAIARKIGAAVTPEEQARLSSRRTVAPEALAAYLRGVFHQQRFTPQDLETALEQFSRALEIDPDYAAALVGTARVWATRTAAGLTSSRDAAPHWSEALRRALELDPDLPEAHMALAHAKSAYDWDWEGAEAEFKRSLELNPSLAEARVFYSQRLDHLGRFAEGTEQMDLALDLDPLNPLYQVLSGIHLIWVGRVDEAVDRLRTTFAKTPGFGLGHIPLWTALDLKGKHREALEELKAHYALAQGDALTVKAIESGYAEGGYTSALRRAAEVLEERARSRHVGALNLASLYDRAGDTAKAVEWLERAYEERDPSLPAVGVIPFSEKLRGDARFQQMLRRLKLPDLGPWTSRAR